MMKRLAAVLIALTALAAPVAAAQDVDPERLYANAYDAYEAGAFETARRISLAAAETGHTRAQVLFAHMAERGLGGEVNEDEAVAFYQLAAYSGDADALHALGMMARDGRGGLAPESARDLFSRAVDAGRDDARVELAMLYVDGTGVEADPGRGRALLQQGAALGSVTAQRALGLFLLQGIGGERDVAQAETWLTAAARGGDADAAYTLGVEYSTGEVLDADDRRAAQFLKIAADADDPTAQADYGLLVYQGRGVDQSFADAADWFRKAAEGGDQEGAYLYAFALAKGEGVERDLAAAYEWALRSAAQGASASLNYEADRATLILALERTLDAETQAAVRDRVGAPDPGSPFAITLDPAASPETGGETDATTDGEP